MLRLYDYPASCNCYKVRLLLAHLDVPYERVLVDIFGGDTLTDEFARLNPARTTPMLQTENGEYLPESAAILLCLARGTGYLPGEPLALAQIVRWLIYEQTDVIPMIGGLRFRLLAGRLTASDPDAVRRRAGAAEVLALLEDHLSTRSFFVDERYSGRHGDLRVHAPGLRGGTRSEPVPGAAGLAGPGGGPARVHGGRGALRSKRRARRRPLNLRLTGEIHPLSIGEGGIRVWPWISEMIIPTSSS
ncbi:MAG TPA: glutathione S-transferase family protein [Solirubrobacteraceae bacterium]|jgi:glutathione S-transferase